MQQKTFQASTPKSIDKQIKDFIKKEKVKISFSKINVIGTPTKFLILETVWFESIKETQTIPQISNCDPKTNAVDCKQPAKIVPIQTSTSNHRANEIGALWKFGNVYSGKIHSKKIKIPIEALQALEIRTDKDGNEYLLGEIEMEKVLLFPIKTKSNPKMPDYRIYCGDL